MAAKGLWNIGKINLPDLGISEFINKVTSNKSSSGVLPSQWNNSAVFAPKPAFASGSASITQSTPVSQYKPVAPTRGVTGSWESATPTPTNTNNQPSGGQPSGGQPSGGQPSGGQPSGVPNLDVGTNYPPAPVEDPYAGLRNEISSGWDSYLASLDQQLNSLPGQVTNQEGIVTNQYNQGVNDLNLQLTQGNALLGTQKEEVAQNQAKNLRSLDENMRNMFMSGNVYLGSRGAGDSSAANQYAYALTKEGNKARGDQMAQATQALSQIQQRESTLKQNVDNEMLRIKSEADNKKLQIGQWFADAQNKVKEAMATGQLNKSTDLANLSKTILNQAMTALQTAQANAQTQQNSLLQWAESNSKTIGDLKSKIQQALSIQIPQIAPANMSGQITTDARGNTVMNPLVGYGATSDQTKKGLFGY